MLARAPACLMVDDQLGQLEQLLTFLAIVASGRCAALADPDWPAAQRAAARASLPTQACDLATPQPDALFYLGFTSGSTGQPKGFCRDHRSWVHSFEACVQAFGPAAAQPLLVPGRIAHSLFLFGMLLGLWSGAGVVLQDRFSAAQLWRGLKPPQLTGLVAVPVQLLLLLAYAQQHKLPPQETVELIMISGARWPRQHSAALQALFPRAQLREFYGASELSFVAWTAAHADLPASLVGQPFAGVDIDIRPLPDGAAIGGPVNAGLIWVRSPMVFSGYVGDGAGDTTACLRDADWLSVRDVGYRDAEGRLHLLGRLDRMINLQARKLFPEELEGVLERHPQIARASVHGVADALRGALVVALVQWIPNAGALPDAAALAAWCRQHLQAYKVPRRFYICPDWAWTVSGKTDHPALGRLLTDVAPPETPCLNRL